MMFCIVFCFFFKQKTAYEMRISDWSSDVCSSDLFSHLGKTRLLHGRRDELRDPLTAPHFERLATQIGQDHLHLAAIIGVDRARRVEASDAMLQRKAGARPRSEEHTSELQSLMRLSYAVFCLKKKKQHNTKYTIQHDISYTN